MSAPLADALRRLGLPLDETIDDGELGDAYRRAARENHPDGAPDEEREQRGETMRAINAARDLVRSSLELLSERAYTELSERENGSPAPAWWEDAIFEDPSGPGRPLEPGSGAHPLAPALRAGAARALHRGRRHRHRRAATACSRSGRVEAFDSSVRVSRRTAWGGLPVELRRIGVEVRFPDGSRLDRRRRRRAARAGWHCPVCGRTSTLGEPRERPCPRCIRRSRIDYEPLGRPRPPLAPPAPQLRELDRVATPFSPRRSPAFRDVDDGLADARAARRVAERDGRGASTRRSPSAEAGVAEAELRVARTRTPGGAERRRRERARHAAEAKRVRTARDRTAAVLDEQRRRVVELDRERTRLERELRARHESSERARRRGQAKRDAERARGAARAAHGRDRAERDRPRRDRAAGRVRELAAGAGQVAGRERRSQVAGV